MVTRTAEFPYSASLSVWRCASLVCQFGSWLCCTKVSCNVSDSTQGKVALKHFSQNVYCQHVNNNSIATARHHLTSEAFSVTIGFGMIFGL